VKAAGALAAAILAAALPPAAWGAELAGAFKGRSVILVSIDTLRADRLGAYGYARPTSPALDAFASTAQLFERAYSHSPRTAESHMSLMTGVLPTAHGVMNWRRQTQTAPSRPEGLTTLAEIYRKAGYRTVAYTSGGNVEGVLGFEHGFDAYLDVGADSLSVARLALADLARSRRPFFLFVHTYAVHDPYLPRPEFARMFADPSYSGNVITDAERFEHIVLASRSPQRDPRFERYDVYWSRVNFRSPEDARQLSDLYDAGIRQMDEDLGALLEACDRLPGGQAVLAIVSDHGEEFGEHRGFIHNSLYEEVLHVPLLLRLPGRRAARHKATVSLSDTMPTLLELSGLPLPKPLQAASLLPLIEGTETRDRAIVGDWNETDRSALRLGDLKLIRSGAKELLFDVAADPGERTDLLPLAADRAYPLRLALERTQEASTALRAQFGPAPPATIDPETRRQLQALGYIGGAP
jgi:arylsulfatase A-like enzyme